MLDGTPRDLKLTMQPVDIDVKPEIQSLGTADLLSEEPGVKNLIALLIRSLANRAVTG